MKRITRFFIGKLFAQCVDSFQGRFRTIKCISFIFMPAKNGICIAHSELHRCFSGEIPVEKSEK
jgi:hypothetical protein